MVEPTAVNPRDRHVRVFVSSTFKDMEAERDVLVKRVFPQIRQLCAARAIGFTEVDLRWGITDEQQAEGGVLPYCLAEIERSRPFFVGLLGDRYGWIPEPDQIPPELLEEHSWLTEHLERSVTELEILHGVLRDPAMASRALFYFRDPAYARSLPPDVRHDMSEVPSAADIERWGKERADEQCHERSRKLDELKGRIRQAHAEGLLLNHPREGYSTPETLGDMVLVDLWRLIGELYPDETTPDPIRQEALRHEAYAIARRSVFVGRDALVALLDDHAAAEGPPLVLVGESGCGKSALIACWAERHRRQHPDDLLIEHYVGATSHSASWTAVVRRILGEIKRRFAIEDEIPSGDYELRSALADWFPRSAGSGRVVLAIDGLNHLEGRDAAHELAWLPVQVPGPIRLIVSTTPGHAMDVLRVRPWSIVEVPLLGVADCVSIVRQYLGRFAKTPPPRLLERIERLPQARNPLFLTAFLDEIRQFGLRGELDRRIEWYLEASDPAQLYRRVITRWQEDFSGEADLVRRFLSSLWAARRGLSEQEMLGALGTAGRPMPRAALTPLLLAVAPSLMDHSGVLGFCHDYLRDAVCASFLPTEEDQNRSRRDLARYFDSLGEPSERVAEEVPWLLREAQAWEELRDHLAPIRTFVRMWNDRFRWDVVDYWAALGPRHDCEATYLASLPEWEAGAPDARLRAIAISDLAWLFHDLGRLPAADRMYRFAVAEATRAFGENDDETLDLLRSWGHLLIDMDELERAEAVLRRALPGTERRHGPRARETLLAVNNLAVVVHHRGGLDEAERLYRRAIEGRTRLYGPDHYVTAMTLNNLAMLLVTRADLGASARETSLDEAGRIARHVLECVERSRGPDDLEVATVASNLGVVYEREGKYRLEEPLLRRALAIQIRHLGDDHPSTLHTWYNLAHVMFHTGRFEESAEILERVWQRQMVLLGPAHRHTQNTATSLESVVTINGQEERARVIRQHMDWARFQAGIVASLRSGDAGNADAAVREWAQAVHAHTEPAEAERVLGVLADHLLRLGMELKNEVGDFARAERCYRLALELAPDDKTLNGNLGVLLWTAGGDIDEAESRLRAAIDDSRSQATFVASCALLLAHGRRDLTRAREMFERARAQAPDDAYIAANFATLAIVQRDHALGRALVEESTRLSPMPPDRSLARPLFCLAVMLALEHAAYDEPLGRLRTLLRLRIQHVRWRIDGVRDRIRAELSPPDADLLLVVLAAIGDRSQAHALEFIPAWQAIRLRAL